MSEEALQSLARGMLHARACEAARMWAGLKKVRTRLPSASLMRPRNSRRSLASSWKICRSSLGSRAPACQHAVCVAPAAWNLSPQVPGKSFASFGMEIQPLCVWFLMLVLLQSTDLD